MIRTPMQDQQQMQTRGEYILARELTVQRQEYCLEQ